MLGFTITGQVAMANNTAHTKDMGKGRRIQKVDTMGIPMPRDAG